MTLALTAISWLLKNWKIALGALAALAVLIFLWQVDRAGYQRRVNEEAKDQVELLKGRLATLERVNADYSRRFAVDKEVITELERKASETPPNTAPCLDRDAARRVRAIR